MAAKPRTSGGETTMSNQAGGEGKIVLYILAALSAVLCFPWGLPIALGLTALANRNQDPD